MGSIRNRNVSIACFFPLLAGPADKAERDLMRDHQGPAGLSVAGSVRTVPGRQEDARCYTGVAGRVLSVLVLRVLVVVSIAVPLRCRILITYPSIKRVTDKVQKVRDVCFLPSFTTR